PLDPVARPLIMLNPLIVATAFVIRKTRLALLPLTASTSGPGPTIVTSLLITNSPPVSTIVPLTLFENTIVLLPPRALLLFTACRSDPAPASALLKTSRSMAVAGTARSIAISQENRFRGGIHVMRRHFIQQAGDS